MGARKDVDLLAAQTAELMTREVGPEDLEALRALEGEIVQAVAESWGRDPEWVRPVLLIAGWRSFIADVVNGTPRRSKSR